MFGLRGLLKDPRNELTSTQFVYLIIVRVNPSLVNLINFFLLSCFHVITVGSILTLSAFCEEDVQRCLPVFTGENAGISTIWSPLATSTASIIFRPCRGLS
jgi:hypothetical protein